MTSSDHVGDAPRAGAVHVPELEARVALRIRGLSKTFPGVQAVKSMDLDVAGGTVHALLGHNGCGKSTLIKCLAGIHTPDSGSEAWVDGEELHLGHPEDAARKGLRFVHQDLGLVGELGAADNVGFVIGFERGRFGRISWRRQAKMTDELLRRFGFHLDPHRPLSEASPPERTAVAIVRAVAGWHTGRGVLILDEPTASLPAHEVDELFGLIRDIRATGTAVILVSHRLDEVMSIADHATVMREGSVVWDGSTADMTTQAFVNLIANTAGEEWVEEPAESPPQTDSFLGQLGIAVRGASAHRRERVSESAPLALQAVNVVGRYLRGVGVGVRPGEIVGVAGLLGSGREELPYVLAGVHTDGVSGTFTIGGETETELSIELARERGVALVPADRAHEGIIAEFTTRENVSLAGLPSLQRRGVVTPSRERRFARRWLEAVSADPDYSERVITTLSGGNQQKAVIARWLAVAPRVLLLSEPTAGVDVGARGVIYEELRKRVDEGLAILMASSDVEDLLAVCDRVIVLRDGIIVAEMDKSDMTKPAIVGAMEGVHHGQQS
jgi:ribose transport system ATP-binding protein